jgi:hypothetical protein
MLNDDWNEMQYNCKQHSPLPLRLCNVHNLNGLMQHCATRIILILILILTSQHEILTRGAQPPMSPSPPPPASTTPMTRCRSTFFCIYRGAIEPSAVYQRIWNLLWLLILTLPRSRKSWQTTVRTTILRVNVSKNRTYEIFRGHDWKIDFAQILPRYFFRSNAFLTLRKCRFNTTTLNRHFVWENMRWFYR